MVRALLNMPETPEPADAADALAVALCHIQIAESKERLGASLTSDSVPRIRRSSREHAPHIPPGP